MLRGKEYLQILKQKAENKLAKIAADSSNDEIHGQVQMTEEIQIYQIELELQNEELRRTQEELELVFERYYNLFNYAPVGYVVTDEVGMLRQANNTFTSMTGIPFSKGIGQPLSDFIVEEDRPQFLARYKAFFNQPENKIIDVRLKGSNGQQVFVSIKGKSFKADERNGKHALQKKEIILSITDTSEIQKAHREAIQQKEIALAANAAKDRIFKILAHDLRSPFHTVGSLIKLLTAKDTELTDDLLGSCNSKVAEVLTMLDNLLKWSQANSKGIIVNPTSVNIQELVRELLELYQYAAEAKGITFQFTSNQATPFVFLDKDLLQTVLRNIFSNAIKYSYTASTIEINLFKDRLEVRDHGIGMNAEQLEKIRGGGTQQSTSGTLGEKGTGIGMSIIHELVKLLPLQLEMSSESEVGTVVVLHFKD